MKNQELKPFYLGHVEQYWRTYFNKSLILFRKTLLYAEQKIYWFDGITYG